LIQAVRLAWRAAASLSALEVLPADVGGVAGAGGGTAAGGSAARDAASAETAIKRATTGTERMGEPRVDSARITVARGFADDASMKLA
jgi:hypothetical protein